MKEIKFPAEYMKEVPDLWSITRSSGKSILVTAKTADDAQHKYTRVVNLVPELGLQQDPAVSIRRVASIV